MSIPFCLHQVKLYILLVTLVMYVRQSFPPKQWPNI